MILGFYTMQIRTRDFKGVDVTQKGSCGWMEDLGLSGGRYSADR